MELPQVLIRTPSETLRLDAFGDTMVLHLGTDDTDGRFSLWTEITPPGGGPPPHYHENEDEWFWPISGDAEFFVDNKWTLVPAKTAVFAPRGSVHTFRNPNTEHLEMLIQTIPGGFDKFFAECAGEFGQNSPPNMDTIAAISARYGIFFVDEP